MIFVARCGYSVRSLHIKWLIRHSIQSRKEKQNFESILSSEIAKREEELANSWQEKVEKATSNAGSIFVILVCCLF